MTDTAIIEEMRAAIVCMDVACDAVERDDWLKAEQALLEVQERSGRLLRELGLKLQFEKSGSEPPTPIKGE